MDKNEAIAELARRGNTISKAEAIAELNRRKPKPKREATWAEVGQAKPLFGNGTPIPADAALTPLQSLYGTFSGAIDETGHGIQQNLYNLFGAEDLAAQNKKAGTENRQLTNRALKDNLGLGILGQFGGGVASSLPFAATNMIPAAGMLPGWLNRGAEAGLWGANQFRLPDESQAFNAGIPAAAAALLPPVLGKASQYIKEPIVGVTKRAFGWPKGEIAKDVLKLEGVSRKYNQQVGNEAANKIKAGREIGVNLTPAEATGSPKIAQTQATIGRSPAGAGKLEEFYRGKGGRYEQENKAVDDFLKTLGIPGQQLNAESARKIRESATKIIEEQVAKRQAAAAPHYQSGGTQKINKNSIANLLEDENIHKAAVQVHKNPAYREASKGIKKNSVEYWDLIKRNLDDKILSAQKKGDKNMARILLTSKNKLLKELDAVSPDYAKARKIFSNESEVLKELTDSNLGKIKNLTDLQLKNVSKILFDPTEIDPKTLNIVRSKLLKENPAVYYDAIAQNMRLKIDTFAKNAIKREAPAFYKAILQNDKNYKMYRDALKHNPEALRRLDAMKIAFQDLGGDFTPKSAAGLEKTGMTNTRDIIKGLYLKLFKGGKYDNAAVDFITNPQWFEKSKKILSQTRGAKRDLDLARLLSKIAETSSIKPSNNSEDEE